MTRRIRHRGGTPRRWTPLLAGTGPARSSDDIKNRSHGPHSRCNSPLGDDQAPLHDSFKLFFRVGSSNLRSALTTVRYAASPVGVALLWGPVTAFGNVLFTPSAPTIRSAESTSPDATVMPARNGWVGLHVAYSGTEAGALTRGRTGKTVEHHVVVCAMD